jgi:gas vesicle protein
LNRILNLLFNNLKIRIMTNDSGNVMLALLTGAAIGAGFGILFAPEKGADTRDRIRNKAIDTRDDLSDKISHAKEELSKTAKEQKDVFDRKLDEAISTMSYKADDIIDSLERKLEDLKKKNAQLQK